MEPNDIDIVDNGALIKVFLLEAPLPWNAESLRNSAGNFWDSFALAHAGLGFLVEETDSARVIEFHADRYTDSFMPNVPPPPPTPSPTPAPSATPPPSTAPLSPTDAPVSNATSVPSGIPTSPSTPSPSAVNTSVPSGAGERFSEVAEETGGGVFLGGVGSQELVWNNMGVVRETKMFDSAVWTSATFVTKITGLLYNDLAEWAQSFQADHGRYQPLSICRADQAGSSADENRLIRPAMDSYEFAWQAFQHLASNGVAFDWEVVIPPKRTAMCLFVEGDGDAVEFVEANDAEAITYFRKTNDCVTKLAAAAANGNASYPGGSCFSQQSLESSSNAMARESAVSLLLSVGSCLDPITEAYVYHNDSFLLRVPLPGSGSGGNESAAAALGTSGAIPKVGIVRYTPEMPKPPPPLPRGGDRAWIVYVAVALVATAVAGFVARTVFRKRRALMAYGDGGNSGMLSSLGTGWRGGVAAGSDFGEFDGVGGGYDGTLFPGDNYGSGSMSGMMHSSSSSSRHGRNWRGGRDRPDAGSDNAENVELKRPLLHLSESPLMPSDEQLESSGGGASSSAPSGRGKGRPGRGDNDDGSGGDAMGGAGGGPRGARSSRDGMSPPPFSRMHGTIGAGPPLRKGGVKESGGSGGGGSGSGSGNLEQLPGRAGRARSSRHEEPDRGTLGDDPFVGEEMGGVRGRVRSMKPSEPEGDEVFC